MQVSSYYSILIEMMRSLDFASDTPGSLHRPVFAHYIPVRILILSASHKMDCNKIGCFLSIGKQLDDDVDECTGKVNSPMCIILSSEPHLGVRRILQTIFRARQEG